MTLDGGSHVTLLVESSRGYANLCRILTESHAGTRQPGREDREPLAPTVAQHFVEEHADGLVCLSGCARNGLAVQDPNAAARLAHAFGPERFFVELQRPYERGDVRRNTALRDLAEHLGVATVATGNVHAHAARRTLLQDTLVAIRCRTSLDGCEQERRGNRESILRAPADAADLFAGIDPAAAARTVEIAERLSSTSPRSSATATPTSPTATSPRSDSSPRSATTPSPTAIHRATSAARPGRAIASRASSR